MSLVRECLACGDGNMRICAALVLGSVGDRGDLVRVELHNRPETKVLVVIKLFLIDSLVIGLLLHRLVGSLCAALSSSQFCSVAALAGRNARILRASPDFGLPCRWPAQEIFIGKFERLFDRSPVAVLQQHADLVSEKFGSKEVRTGAVGSGAPQLDRFSIRRQLVDVAKHGIDDEIRIVVREVGRMVDGKFFDVGDALEPLRIPVRVLIGGIVSKPLIQFHDQRFDIERRAIAEFRWPPATRRNPIGVVNSSNAASAEKSK